VFKIMMEENKDPEKIIEEKWYKAQDDGELEQLVKSVLDENPKAIEDIKAGKMNAIWFLVWQVMKKSQWKANPAKAKDMIMKLVN
jgi:aspartyl-tRNA(Asn)/glutamyl-tRNA(Gln) amidotransferase subunit B